MQEWERQQQRDKLRDLQILELKRKQWRAEAQQNQEDAGQFVVLAAAAAMVVLAIVCFPLFLLVVGIKWLVKGGWIKRVFSLFFIPVGALGAIFVYLFVHVCIEMPGTTPFSDIAVIALQRMLPAPSAEPRPADVSSVAQPRQPAPSSATASTSEVTTTANGASVPQAAKVEAQREVQQVAAASDVQSPGSATPVMPQATAIVASFDCSRASSAIEHMICSTPEAADSDRRLSDAYSGAVSRASDKAALKQDQRTWIKQERNACTDAACLVHVTEARIRALSAM
jgi:uncharacterized protein YecT (DUF1311 family)